MLLLLLRLLDPDLLRVLGVEPVITDCFDRPLFPVRRETNDDPVVL